jgi:hypothetical protein
VGFIASSATAEKVDVETRREQNAEMPPFSRPRLLTGKTQRPEGESYPSPRPLAVPCAAFALGSDLKQPTSTDARTPRPDALARDHG